MIAEVVTYGGEATAAGSPTVQHWQLIVDGEFICDTAAPHRRDRLQAIADVINSAVAAV
jgi:hypothetical protein